MNVKTLDIKAICINTFKKTEKSLNVTWSDKDTEKKKENDDDQVSNYVAFCSKTVFCYFQCLNNCKDKF